MIHRQRNNSDKTETVLDYWDSMKYNENKEIAAIQRSETIRQVNRLTLRACRAKDGMESFYPVNDEKNGILYQKYKELAEYEKNVIFGGRLAEYKYYDMDDVIEKVMKDAEKI